MDSQQYIVSARKYRPATFRTVVGQQALTNTLKNAILNKRLAQAYLFCGPRGVGKTSCARIFAKAINCLNPQADGEACGECDNCRAIDLNNSFNLIELDAASNNGVDQIRTLTEQVNVPPQQGNYRVFIIDEVHMLSQAAFNAFLKTLEEPPSYVVFILATTEKHKVIPTILSRCQIYDFKRITVNDMAEHLSYVASQEGIKADPQALNVIARKADGAMRDALSIFDQVAASTGGDMTYAATIANLNVLDYDYYFRLIDAFHAGDASESLLIYKEIRDKGFDSLFFVNGLAEHVRDLMVAADKRTLPLLEMADDVAAKYNEQASQLPAQWYYTALRLLNDCDRDYRMATSKRLLVELTLVRLSQLLTPATPPFDQVDRIPPLRDPAAGQTGVRSTETPASIATDHNEHTADSPVATPTVTPTATAATAATAASQRPAARPAHRRPHTIRLSDASAEESPATIDKRDTPYSDDAFLMAWNAFAAANPKQLQLRTGMARKPIHTNADIWTIQAAQPSIYSAFQNNMAALVGHLRNELRNDNITVQVELEKPTAAQKTLTPREMLEKISTDNPALGNMLLRLDCEIDH